MATKWVDLMTASAKELEAIEGIDSGMAQSMNHQNYKHGNKNPFYNNTDQKRMLNSLRLELNYKV